MSDFKPFYSWVGESMHSRGRTLLHTKDNIPFRYQRADFQQRRTILAESLAYVEANHLQLLKQAHQNVAGWQKQAEGQKHPQGEVKGYRGDWGEVCQQLTQTWGQTFAVLNMANA